MNTAEQTRLVEWLVDQHLLAYYAHCRRPDGTSGPAWVLRRSDAVNGDSCEAWDETSAFGALQTFLTAPPK